jgi:hypothetical protein
MTYQLTPHVTGQVIKFERTMAVMKALDKLIETGTLGCWRVLECNNISEEY